MSIIDPASQPSPAPATQQLPMPFRRALSGIQAAQFRPELALTEIPAPQKIAPYAVALAADVIGTDNSDPTDPVEQELATGRFILLHDPAGNELWESTFRIVTFIRASVEAEMGDDPLASEVAWTWLVEALEDHRVDYVQAGGTATRVLSESFGVIDERDRVIDIELRASWSPQNQLGHGMDAHLEAWSDMVCSFAGLPPLPEGVTPLTGIRRS